MKQFLTPKFGIALLVYLFVVPIYLLSYKNQVLLSMIESLKEVAGVSTVALPVSPTPIPLPRILEPYGITNPTFTQDTLSQIESLGVRWVRLPILWSTIETGPGAYDWRQVDSMVAMANANNLHIDFVFTNAPPWHMITCKESGKPFAFGAESISAFASIVATRYNGQTNHGFIDAYEIGSEEFDTYGSDTAPTDVACRTAGYYVPVLKAGYHAIKSVSPKSLVGMFGMGWNSKQHEVIYLQQLYTIDPMIGKFFDYGTITYYNASYETRGDPTKSVTSNPDYPTFAEKISLMQQTFSQFNDSEKPIWVSEIGWKQPFVSVALENTYLQESVAVASKARVARIFWYSLDTDGYGLLSHGTPTPVYSTFEQLIRKMPNW